MKYCKTCGKKIANGNKAFCSRECWRKGILGENCPSWKGGNVEVICAECGKAFNCKPSEVKNGRKFCSTDCQRKAQKKWLGEKHPNWTGASTITYCRNCGKEISSRPFEIRMGRGKYCSRMCREKHQTGNNSSTWKGGEVSIPCQECGEYFNVPPSRKERRKYCSRECQAKAQSRIYSGANCVHWKGGKTPEYRAIRASTKYKKWRKAVFVRDNWTCQICGDKTGGNLHAHHIFSFSEFPEYRLDVWNGITLCYACHQKYHPEVKLRDTEKYIESIPYDIPGFENL